MPSEHRSAYPVMPPVDETGRSAVGYPMPDPGLTMRDWFATHAPITFEDASKAYGSHPRLSNDAERASFFAVWAVLRFEYADEMMFRRSVVDDGNGDDAHAE